MATKSKTSKAPRAKRVRFELEAPEAQTVAVSGTFCGWSDVLPLKRQKDGPWKLTMNLPPGRYEYRFVVDGEWRDDPGANESAPNPYGGRNSVLQVG